MTTSTFDIDAWLTEAKPPQRAVTVYGRGDLLSRLQDLTEQRKNDPAPASLAGHPLAPEIARVRAQVEESKRVFHVRGLLNSERTTLLEQNTATAKDDQGQDVETFDATGYEEDAFAVALVDPQITPAQARAMHTALGEGQWIAISRAVEAASSESVDVPLSRLGSESTPTS